MNPSRFNQHSTFRCSQGFRVFAAVFAGAFSAFAQDQPKEPSAVVEKIGNYVFKPIEIKQSPDGANYEALFLFINKSSSQMTYPGYKEPVDGKFESDFVLFQFLKDGKWQQIQLFYCGTGAQDFVLAPGKEYQLVTSLDEFKEQDSPLTARIGLHGFWSEPFVLDWKEDRKAGKFEQAKIENFVQARAELAKAGFKEELLVGYDFCSRLLQSLMKETKAKDMAASFEPFIGKRNVVPRFLLDGSIRISSSSDEVRSQETEYTIQLTINPHSFSHEWFRSATKQHVKINGWGDGFQMRLLDYAPDYPPLWLEVIYRPFEGSKHPTKKDAEKLFVRMLDVLEGWQK